VLLSSSSDVDDLVPTLVAFQIEWNKIRARARAARFDAGGRTSHAAHAVGDRRGAAGPFGHTQILTDRSLIIYRNVSRPAREMKA